MANPLRISEKMRQGVFRALPTELSVNPKIERTRTRTEDTVFSKEVTLPIATDDFLKRGTKENEVGVSFYTKKRSNRTSRYCFRQCKDKHFLSNMQIYLQYNFKKYRFQSPFG